MNSHCETSDIHGITASSILRRNLSKGSKNRRSAVYSETTSEECQRNMKKFTSVDDLQIQLLTINDDGGKEWKKTQTVNSFSSVTKPLDTKQPNEVEILINKDECVTKQTAQNNQIVTQQQNDYSEKIHKETPTDEFDSITRATTILYHVSFIIIIIIIIIVHYIHACVKLGSYCIHLHLDFLQRHVVVNSLNSCNASTFYWINCKKCNFICLLLLIIIIANSSACSCSS